MPVANEYLFFEADQVLTNDHLNQQFEYLDQQERWTRNKLIGIGIVCGLDIVQRPGMIEVSKGVGVTSQGYLIKFDAARQFTFCIPFSPISEPTELPFEYPGTTLPFYKAFCDGKTVFELLIDEDFNKLEAEEKNDAFTISSATPQFLSDYVVVLFLELTEKDLKNCDTFDCNNKGKKITLNIKTLLVRKNDLPVSAKGPRPKKANAIIEEPEVVLKRFNVPYTDLRNSDDVINAFTRLVDDSTLLSVAQAYQYCYEKFKSIHHELSDPFTSLNTNLRTVRDAILKNRPILIQYFYDFIDDLIKAYDEFRVKISDLLSECCPGENWFPLHLVLGEATANTRKYERDEYRRYFIYSPLFERHKNAITEPAFLFSRMKILVTEFTSNLIGTNQRQIDIKITPSLYEYAWLSQRAIPYYYVPDARDNELYRYWNYEKTIHGKAKWNLSYNAGAYSAELKVLQPLLFDIEKKNFFRVEGHIGQNYQQALSIILQQRQAFNLPFDVVAVSGDQLTLTDAPLPQCNMQDLDTDYKLILSEWICKLHKPFCVMVNFKLHPTSVVAGVTASEQPATPVSARIALLPIRFDSESILSMALAYRKGDFMRRYCNPNAGTMGFEYLHIISSQSIFVNPVSIQNTEDPVISLQHYFYEFIDAAEELMLALIPKTAATFDLQDVILKYGRCTAPTTVIYALLQRQSVIDFVVRFKLFDVDTLLNDLLAAFAFCIQKLLQTLKEEYNRRLQQYRLQLYFLEYYKKHPGLEHKAGVPKGGTFVLVYHKAPVRTLRPSLLFAERTANVRLSDLTHLTNAAELADLPEQPLNLDATGFDEESFRIFSSFVDDCQDAPPEKKAQIIDILFRLQPLPTPKYQIPDGAVIADFYLPYLCCSDCPPVAYVVNPPDQVVFDLQPRVFLFDDEHNYPFTAQPPVTNAGIVQNPFPANLDLKYGDNLILLTDEKNVLYLHPAMLIVRTLHSTISYKNIDVAITIIVPDASFTIDIVTEPDGARFFTLKAKIGGADTYEWLVNDVENIFENVASPEQRNLEELIRSSDAQGLLIELNVTYKRNGRVSSNSKKARLTLTAIREMIGKGPFEPGYEKEDEND